MGDLGFDIFVDSIPCGRWFKGICLTGGWDSWILHGAKYEWFNWLFYRLLTTPECLHICWLSSSREAKESIGEWMRDYNQDRLHQSLEYQTPDSVYLNSEPKKEMAA